MSGNLPTNGLELADERLKRILGVQSRALQIATTDRFERSPRADDPVADPVVYDFEALCVPHTSDLRSYAGRLTLDRDLASDLVQDTYVKGLRKWHTFEPFTDDHEASARAWLFRIMSNTFITDYHRRVFRAKALRRAHDVLLGTYDTDVGHAEADELEDDTMTQECLDALDALAPGRRDIVERVYIRGETCQATADALGISIGTVLSNLHRARRTMAPMVEQYAADEYGFRMRTRAPRAGTPRALANAASSPSVLRRPGKDPHRLVPAAALQPEADCVDRVMLTRDEELLDVVEAG